MRFLQNLLSDVERRIKRGHARLQLNNMQVRHKLQLPVKRNIWSQRADCFIPTLLTRVLTFQTHSEVSCYVLLKIYFIYSHLMSKLNIVSVVTDTLTEECV